MPKSIISQHQNLKKQIQEHDRRYHGEDNPTITDAAYDALRRELNALEAEHPELTEDSGVGYAPNASFERINHPTPMASLDNAFNDKDAEQFFERACTTLHVPALEGYTCELKIDGLSVNLLYSGGVLTRALTRGNGVTGEDITANALNMNIPQRISYTGDIEVRGEAYMSRADFAAYNARAEEEGQKTLKNPRNGAAGALRQKDAQEAGKRNLKGIFYGLAGQLPEGVTTQKKALDWLEQQGFSVSPYNRTVKTLQEAIAYHHEMTAMRSEFPFDADGTVIKLASLHLQDELGRTSRAPRHSVAYKFPSEEAQTVIENITIQTGRTGKLTPVARLRPVQLEGTTVSNCTLHNEDYIRNMDLRIGDTVNIHKSGGVIPEILGRVETGKARQDPFVFPDTCPSCGEKAMREEGKAGTFCINPTCPARAFGNISNYASRDVMNIRGLGESLITALIESGLVKDPSDLYLLREEDVANLKTVDEQGKERSVGKSSAERLIKEINASKTAPLSRVIRSFGFANVGRGTGERLARHYATLTQVMQASQSELEQIEDIGPGVARSITEGFAQPSMQAYIQRLTERGVTPANEQTVTGEALKGLTFVLTGTLSSDRNSIENLLKSHGAKTSGSVSSKTSYLVCGEGGGGKREKAEQLGIKTISEEELKNLLNDKEITYL